MILIADLPIHTTYRVYDIVKKQYIFSWLDWNQPGDIPPDIAFLPVHGLRSVDGVLYIDTIS